MILPWVLITLVMYCIGQAVQMRPLQSASIVNKKDHSHVGRSFGRVWRRACGLPYAEAGRQSRPPSRSQPVFRHVRHSTGNPATARHFTRPSARDIDRLSSSIQRGRAAIPRPTVWGRSAIALPLQPPGRFVTFRARCRPLCRPINGVATLAGNNIRDRPEIAPRTHTGDPTPIMPVKGRYYGEIESLDWDPGLSTRECNFPVINIRLYPYLFYFQSPVVVSKLRVHFPLLMYTPFVSFPV